MSEEVYHLVASGFFHKIIMMLASAVVGSLLTYYISIKKTRFLKTWELRVGAYQEVINALHLLQKYFSDNFDEHIQAKKFNEEYLEELSNASTKSFSEIKRSIDVNFFLLSDPARKRLQIYIEEMNAKQEHFFEYLDYGCRVTTSCLGDLKTMALKDLKVK